MSDFNEVKKALQWGATVIPRKEDMTSFVARIQNSEGELAIWPDPYHGIDIQDDFDPQRDGYVVTGADGQKYFLRPLSKEKRVRF